MASRWWWWWVVWRSETRERTWQPDWSDCFHGDQTLFDLCNLHKNNHSLSLKPFLVPVSEPTRFHLGKLHTDHQRSRCQTWASLVSSFWPGCPSYSPAVHVSGPGAAIWREGRYSSAVKTGRWEVWREDSDLSRTEHLVDSFRVSRH